MLAGSMSLRAGGQEGVSYGIFGWADFDTGLVDNVKAGINPRLGFILPLFSLRTIPPLWDVIPPGYEVTLASAGDFYTVFPGGAIRGQRVYASTVDGSPISGETAGADPTPWFVMTDAPPGGMAIISTWSTYS